MLSIRKIVDSYFSKRTFPHWCVLLLDSAILFLSGVFVYWCFNRGTALQLNFWPLTYLMLLCVGVHFIFFAIFRTYSGIIRYSSFNDLIRVALAMGCSALAVIAVHFFTNSCPSRVFAHVQVRHILIAEAIATGLMWLLRVSIKMGLRHLFPDGGCEECLHLWHPRRRHRTREGDPQRETDALLSPRLHLPRSGAWSQRHAPDGRAGLRG